MTDSRLRTRRLGAMVATALLTVALVPGLASAANTRTLYLGSPDAQANDTHLLPTPVSVPDAAPAPVNSTEVLVQIKSGDNQTIAHTILTIDSNPTDNPGLSLNTYYDPNSGTTDKPSNCTDADGVITCDYGNLPAFASRTLAVIVDVSPDYAAATGTPTLFTASATTNNENGTNRQTFLADSGTFKVGAFNPDGLNTFVPPGQAKQLFTSSVGTNNNLSTNVSFKSAGEIVTITEADSSPSQYPCPTGRTCQPQFSEVTTTSGSFATTPYFTWTLTALVPKTYTLSQGFVAHYATGETIPNWILNFKDKSALCGKDLDAKIAAAHQCISSLSLTKFSSTQGKLVVTVVMDHQGGMKY